MATPPLASGTQTAVISTEHTLVTSTSKNAQMLIVNGSNMATGDTVVLRAYLKVIEGGAFVLWEYPPPTYTGVQSDLLAVGPLPVFVEVKWTLQQTAGTGRAYEWTVGRVS